MSVTPVIAVDAPTDPAVMFSVLRGRQIGGRASIALEGEAGINDAVAIALVVGLVEYVDTVHRSLFVVLREFLVEIGVGSAIGAVAGALARDADARTRRRLHHRERALHRVAAGILRFSRRAEEDHHAIADELVNGSVIAVDRLYHPVEIPL